MMMMMMMMMTLEPKYTTLLLGGGFRPDSMISAKVGKPVCLGTAPSLHDGSGGAASKRNCVSTAPVFI